MTSPTVRKFLKYFISLAIALGILWYVFRDQNVPEMFQKLKSFDYKWVIVSVLLAMVSHLFRAYRWQILLNATGHRTKLFRTFLAVMIGYLTNLIMPRMGEVSRCGILKRTDDVPISKSFGSVILERILDFLTFALLLLINFVLEFDRLKSYLGPIFFSNTGSSNNNKLYFLLMLVLLGAIVLIIIRVYKNKLENSLLYKKIKEFVLNMLQGLTSIGKIENKTGFWLSTLFIWVLYYAMSYVVVFSAPETSGLSLIAGLTILTMGSLGMIAPVQGGIGTYHAMVGGALVLYGITAEDGKLFAFILHTSQTLGVIIVGCIALIISAVIVKDRKVSSTQITS
ncbi:lysylphosphatidylglycerol synthase transmembrane domain-containing protein [Fulvivirgaceae bacterium BMA10]|uniref:Lysylphosphatidylglycerol synthase transmembrane domain-containing protein n=1 Tax=Splendidivirga corallicola TaxID=3051826 RepID=A0ABT8KT73_9BACT|nr:lysylphosphatidylglycerol synthase transmembrane domain-containing protein [Fulvivirgaceae bacterium BMA10]